MSLAMTELALIDPTCIQSISDFLRVKPYLGQTRGYFLGALPKDWHKHLDHLNQIEKKEIEEFFIALQKQKAIVNLGLPSPSLDDWLSEAQRVIKLPKPEFKIGFAASNIDEPPPFKKLADLSDLTPRTALEKPTSQAEIFDFLNLHLCNAGRIAIVDRHTQLEPNSKGGRSLFFNFFSEMLKIIDKKKTEEVIVYKALDAKYPEKRNSDDLAKEYRSLLKGLPLPSMGIIFKLVDETAGGTDDLHTRLLVTNHAAFTAGNSFGQKGKSQMFTLISSPLVLERYRARWLDGEHDLKVIRHFKVGRHKDEIYI
jgi:hypothetical protein